MPHFRSLLRAGACALALTLSATAAAAQTYTYVGSWMVGQGPVWTSNPTAMSGQMTAAYLFGGSASDYAISTRGADVALIDFRTFMDGWGDSQYLFNPAAQDFYLSSRADGGYNTHPAYSAYVCDHDSGCHSGNPNPAYTNYAFRVSQVSNVPEPGTVVLLATGLIGVGGIVVRRRIVS